jgi:hypothetical protein
LFSRASNSNQQSIASRLSQNSTNSENLFDGVLEIDQVQFIITAGIIVILFILQQFDEFFLIVDLLIHFHASVKFDDIRPESPEPALLDTGPNFPKGSLDPVPIRLAHKPISKDSQALMQPQPSNSPLLLSLAPHHSLHDLGHIPEIEQIVELARSGKQLT